MTNSQPANTIFVQKRNSTMALEGVNEHIDPFEYSHNNSNNNSRFTGGPNRRESENNHIFYLRNSKDESSANNVS